MTITELIEKHSIELNGGDVGGASFKHIKDGYTAFATELLEMVDADAHKHRDEGGMPDFGESIDKALELLKNSEATQ